MSKRTAQKRTRKRCRSLRSLSLMVTRKRMSWQRKERCRIKGLMTQTRAKTLQQEREEVCAALQYAASFHWLVEEGKACEELKPQPKDKWTLMDKKRKETASNGVLRCCQQVSMHEMWKRQQVHENARNMHRAEVLVKDLGELENATFERARYGKKNGQAGRSFHPVQNMFGPCEAKHGTNIDELLQARASVKKKKSTATC